MKPTLKALGAKRLKLKYDEELSNFAFTFKLRAATSRTVLFLNAPETVPLSSMGFAL
jgi:hypothetical protein